MKTDFPSFYKALFMSLIITVCLASSNKEIATVRGTFLMEGQPVEFAETVGLRYRTYRNDSAYLEKRRLDILAFGYERNQGWTYAKIINKDSFHLEFPINSKVEFKTSCNDHFVIDTILEFNQAKEVILNFNLRKKQYPYTSNQANEDIENGLIQLVMHHPRLYEINEKIKYTQPFGFKYQLIQNPKDDDFKRQMILYNYYIAKHLDKVSPGWAETILAIEDSLIHSEIDQSFLKNQIDLTTLSVPDFSRLSAKMKKIIQQYKVRHELSPSFSITRVKLDSAEIIKKLVAERNDNFLSKVSSSWMPYNFDYMIPILIEKIYTGEIDGPSVVNTKDLVFEERAKNGGLRYVYDSVKQVKDDTHQLAGRANYLLRKITGENFGNVSRYSSYHELQVLQNRWKYWLWQLNIQ